MTTFEVEQKFHVDEVRPLEERLRDLGAVEKKPQQHSDTYYNHPSRDFAETQEAFRVRRVDGVPMITYKGAKLSGTIKARRELEWRLDPGDPDGSKIEDLLRLLSFRRVAVVEKQRRLFSMPSGSSDIGVMIDKVVSLGLFAEIELIARDSQEIEVARGRIRSLGDQLGLHRAETRSYLTMILELESKK